MQDTSQALPSQAPREQTYAFSFHGTGTAFFALVLKNILLTLVTLGVYFPWAKTERRNYLFQNVEIHGHRLRYHGTGKELLIGYLKVVGAYLVFVAVPAIANKLLGTTVGGIIQVLFALALLPLIPFAIWGSRRYLLSRTSWRGVHFRLEGSAKPYAKTFVLGYLLSLVTLGFYMPFWLNKMHRQLVNGSAFGSQRFDYRGDDKEFFSIAIKGFLLTIVTLGIYSFWFQANVARFQMRNTYLDNAHGEFEITGLDLLKLTLIQIVGLTFTAGLAFPWVTAYTLRFSLERLRFRGNIDFSRVYQMNSQGNATADGLADALDVGLAI